jgi:hypothetical protein
MFPKKIVKKIKINFSVTVVSKELYESHIPVRIKSSEREDY